MTASAKVHRDAWEFLRLENESLRWRVAELQTLVADLQKQLADSQRSAKRQAAPFSQGEPKTRPADPAENAANSTARTAIVSRLTNPPTKSATRRCRSPVPIVAVRSSRTRSSVSTRPTFRASRSSANSTCIGGHCAECGKKLRGRHPLQTSAAASQIVLD
jgi:hypothetical protein